MQQLNAFCVVWTHFHNSKGFSEDLYYACILSSVFVLFGVSVIQVAFIAVGMKVFVF